MKKNVLVFPCGSEIGLEIHRSLSCSTHFNLIGASSVEDHGEFVYANHIGGIPFVGDPDFIDELNLIIEANRVDFIFPCHDSVVLLLAQAEAKGNLNCRVITSPNATCEVARSKQKTYEVLMNTVATPRLLGPQVDPSDFPVFLKPDVGQGSKGTHLASDATELNFYLLKDPTLLAMEYLPGKEYTVDCFTDRHRKLRFCEGRERKRISNGISVSSETVVNDEFLALAEKINQTLEFRGVWFFQVKARDNGDLILMEIAPRMAGTMGLVRSRGANLALLSLFDAMNCEICIVENNHSVTIDRALQNRYRHNLSYSHVYLDFDDLVVLDDKVNPRVMAFVYQCLNNAVNVHLLTKHTGDLAAALKKYKLDGVFDHVIWIDRADEKYLHITEEAAIFIDDSFSERKKVYDETGLPVFDCHMIDSLMDC